jgi:hypothetical protein
MNVDKLYRAANRLEKSNAEFAKEITKIAQDLGSLNEQVNPISEDPSLTQSQPAVDQQPSATPATTDQDLGLNPNIKNYANQVPDEEEKDTHKITFSVDVPKDMGELEIMNELMPALKNFEQGNSRVKIKGYQFTQS